MSNQDLIDYLNRIISDNNIYISQTQDAINSNLSQINDITDTNTILSGRITGFQQDIDRATQILTFIPPDSTN